MQPVTDLEVVDLRGVLVPIDPQVMSPYMIDVIRSRNYEQREAARLPLIIAPGERIVEIGGGVGYLSALMGLQRKAEAIVVFEANPALLPLIRTTHRLNGVTAEVRNQVIMPVKRAETATFHVHEHFWASSLMPIRQRFRAGKVRVPVVSFAEMLAEHAPTLLVVDIEGAETALFDGVQLDGVQKVLIEVHHKEIGPAGVGALFAFFAAQGLVYDPRHSERGVVVFMRPDPVTALYPTAE